jgi:L-threonylcarbamoyladenylate synthase
MSMAKSKLARTFRGTAHNLGFLARKLKEGAIVAVPTETVYGLAANAFDANACRKIFRAKRRPATDPLIVHIHAAKQLRLVCRSNPAAEKLMRRFWPGPLTIILPKTAAVPSVVTAGRDSVAVRMPAHRLFQRLLRLAGIPLAAPSANPFGYVSPTTALHVRESLGKRIRFILDGGAANLGLESTIIDLRNPRRPRLLRPGAVTRKQLEITLGRAVPPIKRPDSLQATRAQIAPGLLARHYSPHTPVVVHKHLTDVGAKNEALVFIRRPAQLRGRNVFWLDATGNLHGAARRLFATLRRVDVRGFKRIHVELATGGGLAEAINDRLRRAAAR